jgi:glutamine cyclotransferase
MSNGDIITDDRVVRVLSDVIPKIWIAKVNATYPHKNTSFTEGLEFNNGLLYESTGLKGQSMIAQIDLNSGAISSTKNIRLDENYFGEGITFFGDKLYQLTYTEQKCFVYNKNTLQIEKEIPYVGEGWGLCNDGKSIIMSNGTERITFRNPTSFAIERTIDVYNHEGPIIEINELEYIGDKIYANVWRTNQVLVIEPFNGKVLAIIDCNEIEKSGRGLGEVMNGIAQNNGKIYMTGKNWDKLIEVKIEK